MKVNVTIPVYNEERELAANTQRILFFLREHARFEFELVIADNGSNDRTPLIADTICAEEPEVRVVHLGSKGRGRALKTVWLASDAYVLSYMDVDLASDLRAFPALIESIATGGFDLAIGSRLLKPQLTRRGLKREFISRCYNWLIRLMFGIGFSDAQCGFKGISRKAADHLLPLVEDGEWFMDTELLLLAERLHYRIFDLPVEWTDNPDSRVAIYSTAMKDIQGLMRMRRRFGSQFWQHTPVGSQAHEDGSLDDANH